MDRSNDASFAPSPTDNRLLFNVSVAKQYGHSTSDFNKGDHKSQNHHPDLGSVRRIFAEDPKWSLSTVPSLAELCTTQIAKNFKQKCEIYLALSQLDKERVLEVLDSDIPLELTASLIDDETFWKQAFMARWNIVDLKKHGSTWKNRFFERLVQFTIEHFTPGQSSLTRLEDVLKLSAPFIQQLQIVRLLPPVQLLIKLDFESELETVEQVDHLNIGCVIQQLFNLKQLFINYNLQGCGMNFTWNIFNFTSNDCQNLAVGLANSTKLEELRLCHSRIDDLKVRKLIASLLNHPNIRTLDLSHNIVGNSGARAIGKLVSGNSTLTELIVCDNDIKEEGAKAIAHAITTNQQLKVINFRLNKIGNIGGCALANALLANTTLKLLNISGCGVTSATANALAEILPMNSSLETLVLSSNDIGRVGAESLARSLHSNYNLLHLDLRITSCPEESGCIIRNLLARNASQIHKDK